MPLSDLVARSAKPREKPCNLSDANGPYLDGFAWKTSMSRRYPFALPRGPI